MTLSRTRVILGLVAFFAVVPLVQAQQTSRIGYVMPAGGRQGTTLVLAVGGRYLDNPSHAFVSGSGVEVKVIEYFRPMMRGSGPLTARVQRLAEKQKAAKLAGGEKPDLKQPKTLAGTAKWTPEEEMLLAALKRKVAISQRVLPAPAIGDTVMLQVTIAADAAPGQREIRLETPRGLTNPMAFWVGQLPELDKEITVNEQLLKDNRFRNEVRVLPPDAPTEVALPAVVNGQIMPGGADRFRFTAHQGQKLVIAAAARELIPYISDAVPGWFQAALTLYDDKGHELDYADHYQFHPDPVLYFEVPKDGDYVVEIRDSLYRGREDFVYRIALGEIPFVTSIFPLGGLAGGETAIELRGWNLPKTTFTQDAKGEGPGVYLLPLGSAAQMSSPVLFGLDSLPECLESKEPHHRIDNAQPITLPTVVNGRIDPPDQTDVFRFEGRAGQEIVAEVHARRLGSPLDSVLKLTDAAGRQLALNDDHEDKGSGRNTHHADSFFRVALPADGKYYLHLGDAQHKGGPEYAYRLRISPPRPDFELRIVPSSITGRGGSTVPVTVYAVRKDRFGGEIALALKDPPEGFVLSRAVVPANPNPASPPASPAPNPVPATPSPAPPADPNTVSVPANEDQVKLTLKVVPSPQGGPIDLKLEGSATVEGRQVSRVAVPAEDMMQAFEYRHLVPSQELKVAVSGRYTPPKPVVKIVSKTPVKIPLGGTARLQMSVTPRSMIDRLNLELRKPPAGIAIETVSRARDGLEIVLQTDAEKVKPGSKGNLALTAAWQKPKQESSKDEKLKESDKSKSRDIQQQIPLPNMPSIPFEIVKP